ncbi:MAG: hypothetical protein QMD85_03355 [Candidatus Aenigmarchaeota archaeon]|nr:hypothetical protein [Candidatus Aenigmarchaeota archaeon]MDI6722580.1 hypothetical protein [Candidatus Aenigmarchaeota archaeon]
MSRLTLKPYLVALGLGIGTLASAESDEESVYFEEKIPLTSSLAKRLGIDKIISKEYLKKDNSAVLRVFSPQGTPYITADLVLPKSGIAVTSADNHPLDALDGKVDDAYMEAGVDSTGGITNDYKWVKQYHAHSSDSPEDPAMKFAGQRLLDYAVERAKSKTEWKPRMKY